MNVDSQPTGVVLDVDGTLSRFDGDNKLFAEMAGLLLEDLPPLYDKICRAVDAYDAPAVRAGAHALKGLVTGCGGERAAGVAQSLENAGQANDLNRCTELVGTLRLELNHFTQALRDYLA